MTAIKFSSKADSLTQLSEFEDLGIPPLYSFTVAEWLADSGRVLEQIASSFTNASIAVRSSCLGEDTQFRRKSVVILLIPRRAFANP